MLIFLEQGGVLILSHPLLLGAPFSDVIQNPRFIKSFYVKCMRLSIINSYRDLDSPIQCYHRSVTSIVGNDNVYSNIWPYI